MKKAVNKRFHNVCLQLFNMFRHFILEFQVKTI